MACSTGDGRHAGRDPAVQAYLSQLASLADSEARALNAVAARTGRAYSGDAALMSALRETAIPAYRELVAGLRRIQPAGESLGGCHERLRRVAEAELALLERLERAVAQGDGTAVLIVNQEQRQVGAELEALRAELAALAGGQDHGRQASVLR